MELRPGESMTLTVEGLVENPQEVRERINCHSIIGRQGGKELIMKVDLFVEFICPLLEFSNKAVFFRFDKVRLYNVLSRLGDKSYLIQCTGFLVR